MNIKKIIKEEIQKYLSEDSDDNPLVAFKKEREGYPFVIYAQTGARRGQVEYKVLEKYEEEDAADDGWEKYITSPDAKHRLKNGQTLHIAAFEGSGLSRNDQIGFKRSASIKK